MSGPVSVLAVGGIDPSGGAGLTADVSFLSSLGVRPGTIVTALTVQDDESVSRVEPVAEDLFVEQLEAAARALGPSVRAVKTGLVVSRRQAEVVAEASRSRGWPLVVDPVLVAGTGDRFHDEPGDAVLAPLLEAAAIVTPNLDEAEALAGADWDGTEEGLLGLARAVSGGRRLAAVSGGHAGGPTVPLALSGPRGERIVHAPRRHGAATHGTGCAMAAATAGLLALGRPAEEAAAEAHRLVAEAVREAPEIPGRRISPAPRARRPR